MVFKKKRKKTPAKIDPLIRKKHVLKQEIEEVDETIEKKRKELNKLERNVNRTVNTHQTYLKRIELEKKALQKLEAEKQSKKQEVSMTQHQYQLKKKNKQKLQLLNRIEQRREDPKSRFIELSETEKMNLSEKQIEHKLGSKIQSELKKTKKALEQLKKKPKKSLIDRNKLKKLGIEVINLEDEFWVHQQRLHDLLGFTKPGESRPRTPKRKIVHRIPLPPSKKKKPVTPPPKKKIERKKRYQTPYE